MKTKRTNYLKHFVVWLSLCTLAWIPTASALYNSTAGRWLSRDPIEERGGKALYSFARNGTPTAVDALGLVPVSSPQLREIWGGLTRGKCGMFSYTIYWSLDLAGPPADSSVGGLIVQYVEATFNVTDCAGTAIDISSLSRPPSTFPHLDPSDWPFYEAWTIPPNRRTPQPPSAARDVWSMPEFPACTIGTITISGSAEYYDGESLPSNFWPDPTKPSGQLPASLHFIPPFSPPTSGPLSRRLTASWNCCPNSRRDTIVTFN